MTSQPERTWATRLLLAVLGCWIGTSVFMGYLASANFRTLDPKTMRNADRVYGAIPADERRAALRYAASELNRHYFALYNTGQVILAFVALGLLFATRRGGHLSRGVLIACVLIALAGAVYFVPELTERGRAIDFVPRNPEPAEVTAFYRIHKFNVAAEMGKILLLIGLTISLTRRRAGC